tara:strand:- start:1046 stop:1261 length:216 start_codon:yes stop_codon:yes gene_type:complete
MTSIVDKIIMTSLIFLIMVTFSILWIVMNWPYTPQDAIDDSIRLGPYGIIIDLVVLSTLLIIWSRRERKQE